MPVGLDVHMFDERAVGGIHHQLQHVSRDVIEDISAAERTYFLRIDARQGTGGCRLNRFSDRIQVLPALDVDHAQVVLPFIHIQWKIEHYAGSHIILAGLDLLIWRGERVGMVGPNGAGKSLLFRLILGQETPSGDHIKVGPSVKIGYYAQEHETLDYGRTLIDTVRQAARLSEEGAVRFLTRFLFSYEQARGVVGNLSGGERSRLQMALLMLSGANFLLLDEPTNNLDILSAEVLEDALADFEGTVFVISHDRYFLDRVVDRIVELDEGSLTEHIGGYSEFEAARAAMLESA